MVNYCSACFNNSKSNKDISFFTYPKDRDRRNNWLTAIGREDLITKLVDDKKRLSHRICEEHFEKSGFTFSKNGNVKYLSDYAFPTLKLTADVQAAGGASQCQNESGNKSQNFQKIFAEAILIKEEVIQIKEEEEESS